MLSVKVSKEGGQIKEDTALAELRASIDLLEKNGGRAFRVVCGEAAAAPLLLPEKIISYRMSEQAVGSVLALLVKDDAIKEGFDLINRVLSKANDVLSKLNGNDKAEKPKHDCNEKTDGAKAVDLLAKAIDKEWPALLVTAPTGTENRGYFEMFMQKLSPRDRVRIVENILEDAAVRRLFEKSEETGECQCEACAAKRLENEHGDKLN